jgi:hypothetical protein
MRIRRWLSAALLPAALACGCESMSHTENGALAGGAVGAGVGALIGNATGHTGAGALIGAGAGALTGGLLGHAADKSEERAAQAAAARQLQLTDIVQMAQQHVSDEIIINQIRVTGSVYQLSAGDIQYLKANGVSDWVVGEMQATAYRYPRDVYTTAPVYVYDPPPPVAVGVGVRIH